MNKCSCGLLLSIALVTVLLGCNGKDEHVEAGQAVFEQQCAVCHKTESTRESIGPSLLGVVGRTAGTLEDARFSEAMQKANFVWDEKKLDEYLQNPQQFIPGTDMGYFGLADDKQRRDVIAFLKDISK